MPTLSIIIVSYNTREYLRGCLGSLSAQDIDAEIIVVDNGSADGSVDMARREFPHVRLSETGANLGFARANNLGIAGSSGEYVLLLNSDTVARPGALTALTGFLDAHPDAAAVGPRLLNADGSRQLACYRFPGPGRAFRDQLGVTALFANHPRWGDYRRWRHDSVRAVDFVIGAALLVRRAVIDQIGLLDEGFFMYAEETDWCYRMQKAGWRVYFTPDAEVVHYGGGSGKAMSDRVFAEFSGSQSRFYRKHYGLWGALALRLSLIAGAILRIPVYAALALVGGPRRQKARATLRVWASILRWNLGLWRGPGLRPVEGAAL
jgi:GT2 family glycosyltransferase